MGALSQASNKPFIGTKATASGTAVDFTNIPGWVRRIVVTLSGVSTSGTSNIVLQLGTSSGVVSSGYAGVVSHLGGGTATNNYTNGFNLPSIVAANLQHGTITLSLVDAASNTWACSGVVGKSDTNNVDVIAGSISLAATLDRVRLTMANGTDTFDAGSVNILYE